MNIGDIKTGLQAVLATTTGITVIFANQDGPIPDAPFATILITTINTPGHDEQLPTDAAGDTDFKGNRDFTLSFQVFGPNAYQYALDLAAALERPSTRELLYGYGIVYVNRENVTDLTEYLDTGFEERAGMDIFFRVSSIHSENTGLIEKVSGTAVYNKADGQPAVTENYTIGD